MREEFITAECEFFPEGRKSLPEINGDSYRPHLLPENGAGHLGVSFYRGMGMAVLCEKRAGGSLSARAQKKSARAGYYKTVGKERYL